MSDKKPVGLRKAGDADLHPSTPQIDASDDAPLRRLGATAGDSVGRPDKDKLVALEVQIPKSLRKLVRDEAKRRGVSVDHVVAEALRDRNVQ
jgi:hypothetical protein